MSWSLFITSALFLYCYLFSLHGKNRTAEKETVFLQGFDGLQICIRLFRFVPYSHFAILDRCFAIGRLHFFWSDCFVFLIFFVVCDSGVCELYSRSFFFHILWPVVYCTSFELEGI